MQEKMMVVWVGGGDGDDMAVDQNPKALIP